MGDSFHRRTLFHSLEHNLRLLGTLKLVNKNDGNFSCVVVDKLGDREGDYEVNSF
jgi:hypothetical protein